MDGLQHENGRLPTFTTMLRCFGHLRPYRRYLVGVYALVLGIAALTVMIPQVIRWTIDNGLRRQDVRLIVLSVLALLLLALVKVVFTYFRGRWVEVAAQGVAYDLRNAIYYALVSLSFSYHDRTETGQHLSRSTQDVERVRFLTGRASMRLVEGAVLFIATAVVLVSMNIGLALFSLAAMPLLVCFGVLFGRRFRPLSQRLQDQLGVLTTRLEQNLRGFRVVKAFAQEEKEIERFERENGLWFQLEARSVRLRSLVPPLMGLMAQVSTVAIIWYGGSLVIRGDITFGEFVAFATYLGQLILPIRRLGDVIPAIAIAVSCGERVLEIIDAESEVKEKPKAAQLPTVRGAVVFRDVSFAYSDGRYALRNVSFCVSAGQTVALLGETGCGKSTIISLLPRFYDVTAGTIEIDGHDICEVTLASLRKQIGIVLQETNLFATSIYENMRFGKPGATDDEVQEAARAAQAHQFITAFPEGYQTQVGEKGATLSGGQKQRIAIARALLKDPRILILDDATSSVDTATEQHIQAALEVLMLGRTAFVIAQRLSTVRTADIVMVMVKGRIAASGRHEELLVTSDVYADIYHRQLQPQESRSIRRSSR